MSLLTCIFILLFIFTFSKYLNQLQIDAIDRLIEERMKSIKLNKFGIIIVNSTSIIHEKVFGEGITTKSKFPLASVTKSFTALGILKLGVPLNQTIDTFNLGKYIDDDLAKKITVLDLLSHSSGLDKASPKQVVKKGEFLYSNYGYSLLGKIIEDQSQQEYSKYIKNHILEELNMTDSGTDYVDDFMDSYDNFFGFLTKYKGLKSEYTIDNDWDIPAGYIRSTIEDMGKYIQSYLNGKNNDYIRQMGEPNTKIDYNQNYGMGLFVRNRNGKSIYDHSGTLVSFLTHIYIYPDMDLAYFLFTNTNDGLCPGPFYRFLYNLENLILDDVIPYEQTFTLLDYAELIATHITIDLIIIIIITIPLTYFILTVIKKIKKKKPAWFYGIKGKVIFGVDVILLIILPIIMLVFLTNKAKPTKNFLFALFTITISMMVTFIVKLIYFFLYRKFWEDKEGMEDNEKNAEAIYNLYDMES